MFSDQHFKAVLIPGIMRSRNHNAGIGLQMRRREIQHRRGPQTNALDRRPCGEQSFDQSFFKSRRMGAPVITHNDPLAPCARDHRTESLPKCQSVFRMERLSHNTPYVIFTDNGGIKDMRHEISLKKKEGKSSRYIPLHRPILSKKYVFFMPQRQSISF